MELWGWRGSVGTDTTERLQSFLKILCHFERRNREMLTFYHASPSKLLLSAFYCTEQIGSSWWGRVGNKYFNILSYNSEQRKYKKSIRKWLWLVQTNSLRSLSSINVIPWQLNYEPLTLTKKTQPPTLWPQNSMKWILQRFSQHLYILPHTW